MESPGHAETWDGGGPRESMVMTLVETLNCWGHGDKNWPPPVARQNSQWRDKETNQSAKTLTQNVSCLQKVQI